MLNKYRGVVKGVTLVSQIGFLIVCPPIVMALLGHWLSERFGLGSWIVIVMLVIGLLSAGSSAWSMIKGLDRAERRSEKKNGIGSGTNYNEHI